MSSIQILGALELGFLYGLVAMGVWLSFRILDFPDLTVDGSFPLGAGVTAILIVTGINPWLATFAAIFAGFLAGLTTAWISVRWNILHLLASILTMTALYSINIRIMGRPNVALLGEETIFSPIFTPLEALDLSANWVISLASMVCALIFALIVLFALYHFFRTEKGIAMRATGSNPRMATAQGISNKKQTLFGIALSNALVALAGSIFAQTQGFADVTMGVGTIVVGLAAVILGEAVLNPRVILTALFACIIGSVLYRLAIAFAMNANILGLKASDLNLITAILVGLAMITPRLRAKLIDFKSSRGDA